MRIMEDGRRYDKALALDAQEARGSRDPWWLKYSPVSEYEAAPVFPFVLSPRVAPNAAAPVLPVDSAREAGSMLADTGPAVM
jgi:hypothetical protein